MAGTYVHYRKGGQKPWCFEETALFLSVVREAALPGHYDSAPTQPDTAEGGFGPLEEKERE